VDWFRRVELAELDVGHLAGELFDDGATGAGPHQGAQKSTGRRLLAGELLESSSVTVLTDPLRRNTYLAAPSTIWCERNSQEEEYPPIGPAGRGADRRA